MKGPDYPCLLCFACFALLAWCASIYGQGLGLFYASRQSSLLCITFFFHLGRLGKRGFRVMTPSHAAWHPLFFQHHSFLLSSWFGMNGPSGCEQQQAKKQGKEGKAVDRMDISLSLSLHSMETTRIIRHVFLLCFVCCTHQPKKKISSFIPIPMLFVFALVFFTSLPFFCLLSLFFF